MADESGEHHTLSPSMIGHYIDYNSCPRYFRFRTRDANIRYERDWWDNESVGVFLSEVGTIFEADQLRALADDAAEIVGLPSDETDFDFDFDGSWETVDSDELSHDERQRQKAEVWESENRHLLADIVQRTARRSPDEGPAILYQLPMRGEIEHWEVSGLSDLLLLYPTTSDNRVRSLQLEVKSSWAERSSHQIQAAIYSLLLDNAIEDLEIEHEAAAAIVHREQDLRGADEGLREVVDAFDLDSRITEVRRLLREDGELHTIYEKEFEDVGYTLERKCDGCEFNEICYTKAVENKNIALLGLSQGVRDQLASYGIDSLDSFAELYEREEDKRPYDFDPLPIAEGKEETVRSLSEYGRLGDRLPELVQGGQVICGRLDPTYEEFDFVEFLKGTGNGGLPEDTPRGNAEPPYPNRGLIRVYIYVQKDYVRDRIVVAGARINGHDIEAQSVVEIADELPMEKTQSRDAEASLLRSFFTRLFQELRDTAEATDYGDSGSGDEAYFHLYFYSTNERDALLDAVKRNPTLSGSSAIRDLLGLREGLDQSMVSCVHSEITERLALHYPGTGLVQVVEQMVTPGWRIKNGYHDRTTWSNNDWVATVNGTEVDLSEVFRTGLFERYKPYVDDGDSTSLLLAGNGSEDPDGFYPVHNRFGNQIPLEYIWGINDELTQLLEEGQSTQQARQSEEDQFVDRCIRESVLPYLYRNHNAPQSEREPIRREDVTALVQRLCQALEHVERSIRFKNTFLGKEPLPIELPTFGLPDTSLAEACQDYLSLEHATAEQELLEHYMNPPLNRIRSGESTFFRVTDIEQEETQFGDKYRITGELAYDEYFLAPDRVLDSCKVSGGDGSSSGSWMVMTPLRQDGENDFDQVGINRPAHIVKSASVTVEEFDRQDRRITVTGDDDHSFHWARHMRFINGHRGLVPPDEYAQKDNQWWWSPLEEGMLFILDPYADSWPHERAYDALERAGPNYLYSLLQGAYSNGRNDQFEVEFCDSAAVETFLDSCDEQLEISPKGKQREFIEQTSSAVSVLQGPPGTGKTGFTLAPAILSRLYAFEQSGDALTAGVTAPSHTAVNEALEAVSERLAEYHGADGTEGLEEVELYRVGGDGDGHDAEVTHIDYHDADNVETLHSAIRRAEDGKAHVLLFATPTSMRGAVDKLVDDGYASVDGAEEFMTAGGSIYDLLVIDEASMLDLPNTLLVGAFLSEGGQTLFIGDHRQMEPVQVHDWESEDRRTIEENIPFMSALNFVRFLRGDLTELDFAERTSPEIGNAIPMVGLDRTYRMHTVLADLLTDLVYQDDNIKLKSDQTDTLSEIKPVTGGIDRAMNPDAPVVLLIHDEAGSQDANLTEVAIIEGLLEALEDAAETDIGIVTPHNAQKGRLQDRLGDRVTPNTVEKFQGGERDVIFVSATASDPDYVRAESDFLLNPHRLNVAMSRMKQKLVVIASESVFRVVPTDAAEYNESIIWKRLYDRMGVLDTIEADARYDLTKFLPTAYTQDLDKEDVSVAVYTLPTGTN